MKKIIFSLFVALSSVTTVQAADANAGKEKSAVCSACHGPTGVSASPMYPNLAGQNDAYIIKQLKDFKSGARTDAMMAPMAANLSDADMADLAAHFSGLPSANEQAAASAGNGESTDSAVATAPAGNVEIVSSTPAAAIYKGDVAAGKDKSAACVACHGADGNSLAPIYPVLAGQSANYLAKQLADFKSGERADPVMAGMVANLSPEDMDDLAAYFAVQTAKTGTGEINEAGHKLYIGGDASSNVAACIACHGVSGKGVKQAGFPGLTGQSQEYLTKQLVSFRDGTRGNDNNGIMRNIAIKLSDAQIKDITQYITSLK
ncbi:c-type cytochrome [Colwellia sp. E2M01]|uniref:c-type cytochrome n=1 Tax=Colwellia sp. E2M01 TaxID=2841561 RepID=UPI001C088CC2|nr:c-type cytochrome [Colwellia sp. E2M01]MBU2869490.1 cytochrome c4 [Colwellia sp. E2M01]